MGKAHSHAYHDIPLFFPDIATPVKQVICGRDAVGLKAARLQFGWKHAETDWRRVLERDDVDAIDISAPTNVHKEIVMATCAKGKDLFCEKPLALSLSDARNMLQAARTAGIRHMVGFNYRFAPAVQLAKKLIDEGRVGKIYHFRGFFLQDWIIDPDFPLVWRLQKDIAGSGSHGDLGAHVIDLAHYLVGGLAEVIGMSETFVKQRPLPSEMTGLSGKGDADGPKAPVTVDDATLFLAKFENGALGSFEVSRFAPGHRCTNSFEINGSLGSIRFDFERVNELEVYFTNDASDVQGFRRILATDSAHAYSTHWWPPGHTLGYEHTFIHEMVEWLMAMKEDRQPVPNFEDGVKCQQVLEAVDISIERRQWVRVSDV